MSPEWTAGLQSANKLLSRSDSCGLEPRSPHSLPQEPD